MPWLTAADELPYRPTRVVVAGASGSGKSTLARRAADILDLRYVELDALHHGPNWTPRPEFSADVARFAAELRWITEWQYPDAREVLAERADLMILLDLPRHVVMARVIRRTVSRRLRRTELWNGNVEPPLYTVLRDRDHIIRWAWRTHADHPDRVAGIVVRHPTLPAVRLTTAAEIQHWLTGPITNAARRQPRSD